MFSAHSSCLSPMHCFILCLLSLTHTLCFSLKTTHVSSSYQSTSLIFFFRCHACIQHNEYWCCPQPKTEAYFMFPLHFSVEQLCPVPAPASPCQGPGPGGLQSLLPVQPPAGQLQSHLHFHTSEVGFPPSQGNLSPGSNGRCVWFPATYLAIATALMETIDMNDRRKNLYLWTTNVCWWCEFTKTNLCTPLMFRKFFCHKIIDHRLVFPFQNTWVSVCILRYHPKASAVWAPPLCAFGRTASQSSVWQLVIHDSRVEPERNCNQTLAFVAVLAVHFDFRQHCHKVLAHHFRWVKHQSSRSLKVTCLGGKCMRELHCGSGLHLVLRGPQFLPRGCYVSATLSNHRHRSLWARYLLGYQLRANGQSRTGVRHTVHCVFFQRSRWRLGSAPTVRQNWPCPALVTTPSPSTWVGQNVDWHCTNAQRNMPTNASALVR